MEILSLKSISHNLNRIKISNIFEGEGLICYPTDTLYGLGGNFFSRNLIDKIDRLKKRADKPYSVIVSDLNMLSRLVKKIPDIFYQIFPKFFPGNLTLLFEAADHLDKSLVKNSTKIGIRIPDSPPLVDLVKYLGKPLVSTSINFSDQSPLNSPDDIVSTFPQINLVIDGGILPVSKGSTVIDITGIQPRVVREGDFNSKILLDGL